MIFLYITISILYKKNITRGNIKSNSIIILYMSFQIKWDMFTSIIIKKQNKNKAKKMLFNVYFTKKESSIKEFNFLWTLISKNTLTQVVIESANGTARKPIIGKNISVKMTHQNVDIAIVLNANFGLLVAYKYGISIFTITADGNPIKYKFNASEALVTDIRSKTPL